jgi:V/A-type H+-transporting ATPase subunit C
VIKVEYGYANARIRGMKSRLLSRRELEELAAKLDVDSIISELEKMPYKAEIEEASVIYSGIACVEEALRRNLAKTFRLIFSFVKGEDAEKWIKIFLNKWDIQNIKTILRGKNIHAVSQEILESLAPAGALDDATLVELVKQPDVKAVIDLLATWRIEYSKPLTQHFKEYSERKDLVVLEYALDKFYYKNALDIVNGDSYDEEIIRRLVTTEIDVTNVKSVLRIIRDRTELEDAQYYLIEGGKELNIDKLVTLIKTRAIEGVTRQLAGTSYDFLTKVPDEYVKAEKISAFEKELDKFLLQKALSMFTGDPLSIALVIGYLWAKSNEITNIRIISRGKTEDVSEEALMGELVLV